MSAKSSSEAGPSTATELKHDQVAERARALWIERGSPGGRDLEHWLDAERQLRDELASRKSSTGDVDEAERRLDGLIEDKPSPARRTPRGEQL